MCQEKKGGRGFIRIEDSVDTSVRWLKDSIKKSKGKTDYSDHKQHKDQQHLENKNEKKSNCLDISKNKQAKYHTRRLGQC